MPDERLPRSYMGSPWEARVGFCRALRAGNLVFTAGTLAADAEGRIQGADCYEQCCYIFRRLDHAMREVGGSLASVIKVTAYLSDLRHSEGFMRAHKEFLGAVQPVATAVQVAGLFSPEAFVEIELVALAELG